MTLLDKVVVITGASSGIGRATALAFGQEKAHVVVAARRAERLEEVRKEIETAGGKSLAVPTDVTDRALVQRLLDATLEHFGRVDIWINNAGIGLLASLEQTTPEEMQRLLVVNFLGAFHGCQAALQQMRRQGSGHIVNVSSLAGRFPLPLSAAYTATKYALNGLTEALALELEGTGVQVSLIMPGFTDTEIFEAMTTKIPDPDSSFLSLTPVTTVADRIVRCAKRPRSRVFFLPFPSITLAMIDLFPSIWRMMARRYLRSVTRGKGTPNPDENP